MALVEAVKVVSRNILDASLVNIAVADEISLDEFIEPRHRLRVVLVVVSRHLSETNWPAVEYDAAHRRLYPRDIVQGDLVQSRVNKGH